MTMTEVRFTEISALRTRYSADVVDTLADLDWEVRRVEAAVRASEVWCTLMDPGTTDDMFSAILREILIAVVHYQPHTTEAGFHMLGRLPKGDQALLHALFNHKIEEAEHGLWARHDASVLAGPGGRDIGPVPTPATMAVVAVWWQMARSEDPIGYLGAEYLFEMLTPLLCRDVATAVERRQLPPEPFRFVIAHATEDVKHSNLFKVLICEYLTRYPASRDAMIRCFHYFEQVYPLPVWSEALGRARGA